MSTPEIQYQVNSLPTALVAASENFHVKCMQHLARAQIDGKRNWDDPNVSEVKEAMAKAVVECDWTSVANYAMILNHHGVVADKPKEEEKHWSESLPSGAVFGF